jgi:hypothetical protein
MDTRGAYTSHGNSQSQENALLFVIVPAPDNAPLTRECVAAAIRSLDRLGLIWGARRHDIERLSTTILAD